MKIITKENLINIYQLNKTDNKANLYADLLNQYMEKYEINNRYRVAAFLAQIGHESARLQYTEEIASGAKYENRKDLGNIYVGDGVKFKGRGLIQITGRHNYKELSEAFNIDFLENPKMLSTPLYAVASACWWWKTHGLNELADNLSFDSITKKINGGLNGKEDRDYLYNKALAELKPV